MQRDKILIVDDSEMNRSLLADMLSDNYDIIEAEDGIQAINVLAKQAIELSLVLLDIVMPNLDGFGVLDAMNQAGWIEDVPVIIISAENSSERVERAYELGATDFIARPFDERIVQRRVMNTLLLYAKQKKLVSMVEEQVYENERRSDMMIDILSHIVEFRNGESGLHILHVRLLTDLLLSRLVMKTDKYGLTTADIALIDTASALHDIGKIAIDEKILNKPGRLTAEEFAVMKTHAAIGADMLKNLAAHQEEALVKTAAEICRWHHERYDGRGYPDGLVGDEIPIAAQVVALADVYDALTSERVYKPPFSHEEAVRMITAGECGVFNPILLECLAENAERLEAAMKSGATEEMRQHKLRSMSEAALQGEGGMSKRTLQLLDKERMRNSLFASMTDAIQIEYSVAPPMLFLSAWGAEKLGLDEITTDPLHCEALFRVLDKHIWDELAQRLRDSGTEDAEVRMDCPLHYAGGVRWHRVILRAIWSDDAVPEFTGALGIALDIHDAHLKIDELAKKATKDALTGLLNRESARQQIEVRMQDRPESNYAMVIFDLDYFKSANDTYGHMFGDRVLKYVAQELIGSIRGTDISCRVGGDEFLLFLEYKTDIEKTIDRIFHSLCGKYEQFRISVSMGVALGEVTGLSYDEMFHAADAALYSVKRSGRGEYCFYDESLKNLLDADFSTSIGEIDETEDV